MDRSQARAVIEQLRRAGNLRVSELSWFLGIPYSTLRKYMLGTFMPSEVVWSDLQSRLALLQKAIFTYRLLPIPNSILFTERRRYVEQCATNPDSLISKSVAAESRVQVRAGARAGRSKTAGVGAN